MKRRMLIPILLSLALLFSGCGVTAVPTDPQPDPETELRAELQAEFAAFLDAVNETHRSRCAGEPPELAEDWTPALEGLAGEFSPEEIDALLRELRMKTPDEIKRYQKIISNRDAILNDARQKADALINEAAILAVKNGRKGCGSVKKGWQDKLL